LSGESVALKVFRQQYSRSRMQDSTARGAGRLMVVVEWMTIEEPHAVHFGIWRARCTLARIRAGLPRGGVVEEAALPVARLDAIH
jgi:hypothetical protein